MPGTVDQRRTAIHRKTLSFAGYTGLCCLLLLSCSWNRTNPAPPTGPGARYPNLASTRDGRLLMSWWEPDSVHSFRLRFATFSSPSERRTGKRWSKPRTITAGTDLLINWADIPSIFHHRGDTLAAHWPAVAGGGTYEYDVNVATSTDGGYTWSAPIIPHHDGTLSEHGFGSFFHYPGNSFGLAWLDGRQMAAAPEQKGEPTGAMSLYAGLFAGSPGNVTETLLDDRVCECCPTSALTLDDRVLVAYRDRSPEEIRNMSLMKFQDGKWGTPKIIHNDGWQIPGCPVNGPALAGKDRIVGVAWFTAPAGESAVLAALSTDGGDSFTPPVQVDLGKALGRVDLVQDPDGFIVSWMEFADTTANLYIRRISPGGTLGAPYHVASLPPDRASGFPKMEILGHHLFITWTDPENGYRIASRWIKSGDI